MLYYVVVKTDIRSTWKIIKWEIGRLAANWKRAAAVLLLPAVFMMIALNIFPVLINYMATGNLGRNPVTVVAPPDTFEDYLDEIEGTTVYNFKVISQNEFERDYSEEDLRKSLKKGTIWIFFEDGELPFDEEIERYYNNLADGYPGAVSHAIIHVTYDKSSTLMETKVESFEDLIIEPYKNSLLDRLGGRYASEGRDPFMVDNFNVVTKIMDNRATANKNAARVVPGIVMLLSYYCVYSLACDLFAMEKSRGFFDKLLLSPVSGKSVVAGKVVTMMLVSTFSAVITMFLMFMSSWLNWSNDAMSLLPFGMLLLPWQVAGVFIVLIAAVYLMSAAAVYITMSLQRLQDIIVNLQLPLVLFLIDFFLNLFRFNRPLTLEYLMPFHNNICLIRDIYASQARWWMFLIVIASDVLGGMLIFKKLYRKVDLK
ncbi:ABC-type Na+ efflux pump, permease component [Oscillospiraceae bacterium]|nr:ABC-type Na+ efflux pump, permease component [Oscillospiraceae bacterium]